MTGNAQKLAKSEEQQSCRSESIGSIWILQFLSSENIIALKYVFTDENLESEWS